MGLEDAIDRLALSGAPFNLDAPALAWVEATHSQMSTEQKIRQIMVRLIPNNMSDGELRTIAESGVGGVTRFANGSSDFLQRSAGILRDHAAIPLLSSGDFEFDEVAVVGGVGVGTQYPNQLAVAASGTDSGARRMAEVAAREAQAAGFNWSFTPVADLSFNPRNPLIVTRCFGDDPDRVAEMVSAYVQSMETLNVATSTKHFPGDGVDDRDQHLAPTKNTLAMDAWWSSYGKVFRAAIAAGTRTIMAGHISLPAYAREQGLSDAEAYLPATLSPVLNESLLRGELGFRGLILSDATEMAGFQALGARRDLVVACLNSGCDMLLFVGDRDHEHIRDAILDGRLSSARLDEACLRVLALKASLGLHHEVAVAGLDDAEREKFASWRDEAARASVVLLRDDDQVIPLSPRNRRRVVVAAARERGNVFRKLPELEIPRLFEEAGFEVARYGDVDLDPDRDVLIYVVADEAKQGKIHLRMRWDELQPGFPRYMDRHFDDLPTILISLGNPYAVYDAPQCRTVINAHSPVVAVQRAVVDAVTGRSMFTGTSPVNAFAGLDRGELDAHVGIRRPAP